MRTSPRWIHPTNGTTRLPVYRRWWFWLALALVVLLILSLVTNLPEHVTDAPKPALPEVQR
jgi:hypothetical protein